MNNKVASILQIADLIRIKVFKICNRETHQIYLNLFTINCFLNNAATIRNVESQMEDDEKSKENETRLP